VERMGEQTYRISELDGTEVQGIIHVQRLKPYTQRLIPGELQEEESREEETQEPQERVEQETNEYEVEAIMGKRKKQGRVEYLVKWLGYPDSENTWVQARDMNAPDLIKQYNKSRLRQETAAS